MSNKKKEKNTEIAAQEETQVEEKRNRRFGDYTEKGDNARYLRHALASFKLPPIDISDPAQVEERIFWYFDHCGENDMKPTVSGLSNALGIHRDTFNEWKNGERRSSTHNDIIKKAYKILEELWEDYMMNGKINPASGIFLGKNLFGYRDEVEVKASAVPKEEYNTQEILERYSSHTDYKVDEE